MKYAIGFDGGGTKTEMVVVDENGHELFLGNGGASNPKAVTFEKAMFHITELLDGLYGQESFEPELCLGICLGIAGITLEQEKTNVQEHIRQYYGIRGVHELPVRVTNDAEIALMSGLGDNKGIIAIAGTGAIVYGITPAGLTYRAGGWGHILGDKGSGYEIGLQTLQAVMSSFDGVRPPTGLTELILAKYGLSSPLELRTYIYQPHIQKKHIAEFAELCIQASEAGDQPAQGIIATAAKELADLTAAIRAKDLWFENSPVAVTGSIFTYSRLFEDTFKEQLGSVWTCPVVIMSEQRPAYGAAMLAI